MINSKELSDATASAIKVVAKDPLYKNKTVMKVFIVDNKTFFKLLTFFNDYIAVNFFGNIYIMQSYIMTQDIDERLLQTELVHEAIHSLQAQRYGGWIKSLFVIPNWVKEGYAVYRSRDLAFDKKNISIFCSIRDKYMDDLSNEEKYLIYGLLVKYAIEHLHESVDDLHMGNIDYPQTWHSLCTQLCLTNNSFNIHESL